MIATIELGKSGNSSDEVVNALLEALKFEEDE
jgi:hypothetical protein